MSSSSSSSSWTSGGLKKLKKLSFKIFFSTVRTTTRFRTLSFLGNLTGASALVFLLLFDDFLGNIHILFPLDGAARAADDLGSLVAERVLFVQLIRQVIGFRQDFIFKVIIGSKFELWRQELILARKKQLIPRVKAMLSASLANLQRTSRNVSKIGSS